MYVRWFGKVGTYSSAAEMNLIAFGMCLRAKPGAVQSVQQNYLLL